VNRATKQKLSKLRALVDHPETPYEERENAKARINEIEERVRKEEDRRRYMHLKPSARDMAERVSRKGITAFKAKVRAEPIVPEEDIVHDAWPFGWRGQKEQLSEGEYEFSSNADGMCFAWECPDCGDRVERREGRRKMLQVSGSRESIERYIARMRGADRNQLCVKCWRKWSEQ